LPFEVRSPRRRRRQTEFRHSQNFLRLASFFFHFLFSENHSIGRFEVVCANTTKAYRRCCHLLDLQWRLHFWRIDFYRKWQDDMDNDVEFGEDDETDVFATELTGQADVYAHGECHVLASVLGRMTGWAIHAAIAQELFAGHTFLVHAWVKTPDGRALDAHGVSDPDDLLGQYPYGDEAEIYAMTQDEVMKIGSGRKILAKKSRETAEAFARELLEKWGPFDGLGNKDAMRERG
jgi:hypothetical protein